MNTKENYRAWDIRILEAEQRTIKTAPMAAAIQIGKFYQDMQRILNMSYRPQFFFRMGYTDKATMHSPRLLADKVV